MKDVSDSPHAFGDAARPAARAASGPRTAALLKRGRDTVVAIASPGRIGLTHTLTPEQRLLMRVVNGRLSAARVARLAGLSEEVAMESLAALCGEGLLKTVDPVEMAVSAQHGTRMFKFGPYDVVAQVGEGGMGSVFVCRRTGAAGFQRLFALKLVSAASRQPAAAAQSFAREVAVGRLLTHANVQSVIDVRMYSDELALVLDYVEGTDLEELLSTVSPLPSGIVVTILMDVLRGLQAAHDTVDEQGRRLGMVHGDVSPSNILIGLDGVSRLSDFGTARFTAMGEDGRDDSLVLGKPSFMAPEQFRGEVIDRRVDIFAIGVVMWTALTGRELFADENCDRIARNVLEKEIVPPSTYGAPACIDEVCMRALSRKPQWRYASADEMADDLLRISMANRLRATPTQLADYVRYHLGAKLAARKQQIVLGSPAVPTEASAQDTGAHPIAAVTGSGRKRINPTVVLPQNVVARGAQAAQSGPPSRGRLARWLSVLRRPLVIVLAVGLIVGSTLIAIVSSFRDTSTRTAFRASEAAATRTAAATTEAP